jgi:hypothetical protein
MVVAAVSSGRAGAWVPQKSEMRGWRIASKASASESGPFGEKRGFEGLNREGAREVTRRSTGMTPRRTFVLLIT